MSMHAQNLHQPQPQQPQQPQSNMTAKWHIPQSAQQSNGNANMQPSQSSLAMQFGAKASQNYKISLKSPSSMKPSAPQNGTTLSSASASTPATANNVLSNVSISNNLTQTPIEAPSPVTSTNPKTPSPNTNDVRQLFDSEKKNFL